MSLSAAEIAAKAKAKVIAQATQGYGTTHPANDGGPLVTQAPVPAQPNGADPMAMMAQALRPYLGLELNVDEAKVKLIIEATVAKLIATPQTCIVNDAITGNSTVVDMAHPMLATIVDLLDCNKKPFLVGPAGSFKTTNGRKAAQLLGYPDDLIFIQSVSQATTEGKLLGFIDAHGVVTSTMFRRAYTEGGFYMMDEIDNGSANALAVLNAAIDNGHCGFPDGMKERHPNFRFCAAGNTYGKGADRQYVGRNQLDAATLNRLVVVEWNYDIESEKAIARSIGDALGNGGAALQWTLYVQKVREAKDIVKALTIISPRQIFDAIPLIIRKGWTMDKCADLFIWAGMTADQKNAIKVQLAKL